MKRIFVSGPPASGKTYLGNDLEEQYGWTHLDCEALYQTVGKEGFALFLENPLSFLPKSSQLVLTWGFLPENIATVRILKDAGFTTVWLTADADKLISIVLKRAQEQNTLRYDYFNPRYWAREMNRLASTSLRLLKPDYTIKTIDKDGNRIDAAPVLINLTKEEQCPH